MEKQTKRMRLAVLAGLALALFVLAPKNAGADDNGALGQYLAVAPLPQSVDPALFAQRLEAIERKVGCYRDCSAPKATPKPKPRGKRPTKATGPTGPSLSERVQKLEVFILNLNIPAAEKAVVRQQTDKALLAAARCDDSCFKDVLNDLGKKVADALEAAKQATIAAGKALKAAGAVGDKLDAHIKVDDDRDSRKATFQVGVGILGLVAPDKEGPDLYGLAGELALRLKKDRMAFLLAGAVGSTLPDGGWMPAFRVGFDGAPLKVGRWFWLGLVAGTTSDSIAFTNNVMLYTGPNVRFRIDFNPANVVDSSALNIELGIGPAYHWWVSPTDRTVDGIRVRHYEREDGLAYAAWFGMSVVF